MFLPDHHEGPVSNAEEDAAVPERAQQGERGQNTCAVSQTRLLMGIAVPIFTSLTLKIPAPLVLDPSAAGRGLHEALPGNRGQAVPCRAGTISPQPSLLNLREKPLRIHQSFINYVSHNDFYHSQNVILLFII